MQNITWKTLGLVAIIAVICLGTGSGVGFYWGRSTGLALREPELLQLTQEINEMQAVFETAYVPRLVVLPVEGAVGPEDLTIDLNRTAIVVVDMQNFACKPGGMFDKLYGPETIANAPRVIEACRKVIEAGRAAGLKIIYLRYAYKPDLSDTGGLESPNWWKEAVLSKDYNVEGNWNAEIVPELTPQPGDVVVTKNRYSGFYNTELQAVLKTYNIKYLIFVGLATNVCVDSTIRDAYFNDYWCILVSDACASMGPPSTQDATIWIVKTLFGWVITVDDLVKVFYAIS